MAFSADSDGSGTFTEPNVVPLVDVMLVLLIIFMVTATVSQSIKVDLPKATVDAKNEPHEVPPITISFREGGEVFLGEELVVDPQLIDTKLAVEAQKVPQPDVLIRADSEIKYAVIQDITTRVRQAGMRSIKFVSEPEK